MNSVSTTAAAAAAATRAAAQQRAAKQPVLKHPQRNGPCPCGSGKKYKKCCLARRITEEAEARRPKPATQAQAGPYGDAVARGTAVAADARDALEMRARQPRIVAAQDAMLMMALVGAMRRGAQRHG